MIQILSNFYIKEKKDIVDTPPNSIIHTINTDNIEEKLPTIVEDYKNLRTIVVIYSCKEDIKYLLSIFTKSNCNIRNKTEFEDVLLMNGFVFL